MTSMAKKKKLSYLIALLTIFFSCSVSHRKLNNGEGNSVPKEDYVWTNQSKFNSETYNQIDTDYFYELVEEYWSDNKFGKVRNAQYETLWKKKLQFYSNGRVRRFASKLADPNPEITGNRGIVYNEQNNLKIDFLEGVSNNRIVINSYKVKVEGEYIYMFKTSIQNEKYCSVYKKSDFVNDEYRKYKADW